MLNFSYVFKYFSCLYLLLKILNHDSAFAALKRFVYFHSLCVLSAYVAVYHLHALVPAVARRGRQILGTRVTGGCEPPYWCWELIPGPLQEQQMHFTTGCHFMVPSGALFLNLVILVCLHVIWLIVKASLKFLIQWEPTPLHLNYKTCDCNDLALINIEWVVTFSSPHPPYL